MLGHVQGDAFVATSYALRPLAPLRIFLFSHSTLPQVCNDSARNGQKRGRKPDDPLAIDLL
jgi:hypothetical protein